MAAVTPTQPVTTPAAVAPSVVFFTTPDGDHGFASRFGRRYPGRDRWRGWELCGIQNRRAGAALVGNPGESIPVRLVAVQP